MAYPPFTAMRSQFETQLAAWGKLCDILRFSSTKDQSGRLNGSYASILSGVKERIWIQPYSITRGGSSVVNAEGLASETTHIGYQAHGGATLIPKDRITESGTTFSYDVVDQQLYDTHNEVLLKQVRRS